MEPVGSYESYGGEDSHTGSTFTVSVLTN